MGLVLKHNISPSAVIGLWEIDENENRLLMPEAAMPEISNIKSRTRRSEICSTQLLLKELCSDDVKIFYDTNGKPHLKNSPRKISISHSHKLVAAIIEASHETGIDIQEITPKILRIQNKFLNEPELKSIDFLTEKKRIEHLHVIWGAKECIFKAHGKGKIIFSENIFVKPFHYKPEGVEIFADMLLPDEKKSFSLEYKKQQDYMLVYITNLRNIVT